MKFSDPFETFNGLKGFPNVVCHGMTLGDWNCVVITDWLLDLSRLKGVEELVYRGKKSNCYTPKVKQTTWEQGFNNDGMIEMPVPEKKSALVVDWGPDQWKLFHAF